MVAPKRLKLKKGDITLRQVYVISKFYYKNFDDKSKREKLDVTSCKIIQRLNFEFDPAIKQWKQKDSGKRHYKLIFIVTSQPISYQKTDTINKHKFPVFVVFYDLIGMGWNSPFRWRTGGFQKILFPKKGADKKERTKIINQNIIRGNQLGFFYTQEHLLATFSLLYGVDRTNKKLPYKTNPAMLIFFDKHMLFIIHKVLRHLLSPKGISLVKNKTFK